MVNKKAYLKTLEALIAISIFLIFLVTALAVNQPWNKDSTVPNDIKLVQDTILNKIESDEDLRNCMISDVQDDTVELSEECIRTTLNIEELIPPTLNSLIQICWQAQCPIPEEGQFADVDGAYKEKTIYADSLIIQHTYENNLPETAVLRLYLWRKVE